MARKSKLTDEERIAAVQEYLDGKGSIAEIARRHRISSTMFSQLVKRAQSEGLYSIRLSSHNKKYPKELKLQVVQEYLSGKYEDWDEKELVFRKWGNE